jgi:hypothetical protein
MLYVYITYSQKLDKFYIGYTSNIQMRMMNIIIEVEASLPAKGFLGNLNIQNHLKLKSNRSDAKRKTN